mmetsp:Transcript_76946/g.184315  ORF Transcript_76946/g.184315 Transcript_76946/m.184315 type:complete len:202 (-) Transcript_76946:1723-2328(-)
MLCRESISTHVYLTAQKSTRFVSSRVCQGTLSGRPFLPIICQAIGSNLQEGHPLVSWHAWLLTRQCQCFRWLEHLRLLVSIIPSNVFHTAKIRLSQVQGLPRARAATECEACLRTYKASSVDCAFPQRECQVDQHAHEENEEGNEEAATIAEGNDHMTADKGNSTLVGLVESIPGHVVCDLFSREEVDQLRSIECASAGIQ